MNFLRIRKWTVLMVAAVLLGDSSMLSAQLRLPNLFNNNREVSRAPINRGGSDVNFTRDFGVPTPHSLSIPAKRGHQTTFYIGAQTNVSGSKVEFLVREFPASGKIISIISNPKNQSTAEVIYFADPSYAATRDSFTFVARYPGGRYSAPVQCDIQIGEFGGDVKVTSAVDFGSVTVGASVEKEIVLENRGGSPYQSNIQLYSPWKVVSPPGGQVAIGAYSKQRIRIAYQPTFEGPAVYRIPFGRGEFGTCTLMAKAVVPFSFQEENWEMTFNPETKQREGNVGVLNNGSRPLEVFMRTSSRLIVKGQPYTILFPNKVNLIPLYMSKDDTSEFEGGIELKLRQGYSAKTAVFGEILPPMIAVEVPGQFSQDVINFGQIQAGRSLEKGIVLQNIGGQLARVDIMIPEPFRVLSDIDRPLAPLERLEVAVGFYPDKDDRGKADQYLTIIGPDKSQRIRLVANATRPPDALRIPIASVEPHASAPPKGSSIEARGSVGAEASYTRSSDPSSQVIPVTKPKRSRALPQKYADAEYVTSPLGFSSRVLVSREYADELRPATDFEVLKNSAKSFVVGWTAPKDSELEKFVVEMRAMQTNPDTHSIESVWVPYPKVTFDRIGRLVKAKVSDLKAQNTYELRVFTIDINGRSSKSSTPFKVTTTRTMDWTYIYLSLAMLAVLALGFGVRKAIQDRRGEVYQSEYIKSNAD